MSDLFELTPRGSAVKARVWVEEDRDEVWFAFAAVDSSGQLLAAGGADRELTTTEALVVASREVIDWAIDIHVARHLKAVELSVRYDDELAALLGSVWAEAR